MELRKLLAAREKVADSVAAFEAEAITHRAILAETVSDFDQNESSRRIAEAKAHDQIHGDNTADPLEIEERRRQAEHISDTERQKAARKALETAEQMLAAFEKQGNNLDVEIEASVKVIAEQKYKAIRDKYIAAMEHAINLMVEAGGYYKIARDGWNPRVENITIPGLDLSELPKGFTKGSGGALNVSAANVRERIVDHGYTARETILQEAK